MVLKNKWNALEDENIKDMSETVKRMISEDALEVGGKASKFSQTTKDLTKK